MWGSIDPGCTGTHVPDTAHPYGLSFVGSKLAAILYAC
jgi:hypothetical protein